MVVALVHIQYVVKGVSSLSQLVNEYTVYHSVVSCCETHFKFHVEVKVFPEKSQTENSLTRTTAI